MKSSTTPDFWRAYRSLPPEIKKAARKQFQLWRENHNHPSLQFKKIRKLWSARINDDFRALALYQDQTYYWIWVGPHNEYARMIANQ